ncbi:MAG: recombination regulator RecX [Candidatus Nanopelagicales bacterium]|jgi:regulatory protein|nr:recombination regulator RecX [Candidatus Nanopelagicales bacterium]
MARRAPEPPADFEGPQADPEQVARTILLRRLEVAPRTRSQLAATLAQRGVPEDVATRVLDRFEEVGLVDDATFARLWVQSRQAGRGLSSAALRQELRRRGVVDALIDEALAQVDPEDELAAARALVARRLPSVAGLPRATQVRRLTGALARKGYGAGLAFGVVREMLDDADQEQDGLGELDGDGAPHRWGT